MAEQPQGWATARMAQLLSSGLRSLVASGWGFSGGIVGEEREVLCPLPGRGYGSLEVGGESWPVSQVLPVTPPPQSPGRRNLVTWDWLVGRSQAAAPSQTPSVLSDLDGHSDPEESFARDLPDFPSINVDPAGLDDEDDTSIGMPSLMYRSPPGPEEPQVPPATQGEATLPELLLEALPAGSSLTSNLAGLVSQSVIQLALSGASQPGPSGPPPRRATRGFLRAPSSDLDTDAEGDDFELLDQSELNQLDPAGSRSH